MPKIMVLIVTYNRINYLKKLLEGLNKQTININKLCIVDNFSNDETNGELIKLGYAKSDKVDIIQELKRENTNILYYRNSQNTGGSGGFAKGFSIALKYEWDYLWIMDDDVLPANNCLEELLKFQTEKVGITIPNRTTDGYSESVCTNINLKNPFKFFMDKKTIRKINKEDINIDVVDITFEGPLISREVIEKVGLPDEKYFIQFDDTDYATRALNYTKIQLITASHLYKQIIPEKNKRRYMNWKDYYSFRNYIFFCKKYGQNAMVRNCTSIILWINLSLKALLKFKFKNFKIINKVFIDGIKGKSGKTIEPRFNIGKYIIKMEKKSEQK